MSSGLARNEENSHAAVAEVELEHGQPSGSLRGLSRAKERGRGGVYIGAEGGVDLGLNSPY